MALRGPLLMDAATFQIPPNPETVENTVLWVFVTAASTIAIPIFDRDILIAAYVNSSGISTTGSYLLNLNKTFAQVQAVTGIKTEVLVAAGNLEVIPCNIRIPAGTQLYVTTNAGNNMGIIYRFV
jgi:hypothetical protein